MADYFDIFGQKVQYLSSDPSNLTEGQVWYNSTSNTAKVEGYASASWATGGTFTNARYLNAGAGTQTAGLMWGGRNIPIYSDTQEYNGTSWTSGGSYPKNVSSHGGTGSQTAGLSVAGLDPGSPPAYDESFEYDGSTWSSDVSMPTQGFGKRVFGTQTSAVATGGGNFPAPTYNTTNVHHYNGTSWTAGTALPTLRSFHGTGGSSDSSGFILGGRSAPGNETAINKFDIYDGTTWTNSPNYPTVVKENNAWGDANDAIQAGGSVPSATNAANIYNGTTWTATANVPQNLTLNATTQGSFNTSSGATFGGSPPIGNYTYEFTGDGPQTQTITTS